MMNTILKYSHDDDDINNSNNSHARENVVFCENNDDKSFRYNGLLSAASYPVPHPLLRRLRLVCATIVGPPNPETLLGKTPIVVTESIPEALTQLVGNSLEAMDSLYFSKPPQVRRHPSFQHRLCIRVRANSQNQTLTISDLGVGMTRADLINSLGIGKEEKKLPDNNNNNDDTMREQKDLLLEEETSEEDDDDDDDENENDYDIVETRNEEDYDDSEQEEASQRNQQQQRNRQRQRETEIKNTPISCVSSDVGGFYTAFCTLGIGVRVGTKSKFDDYYEFEIGSMTGDLLGESAFTEFIITRPLSKEGAELSAHNGFDQFEDVRGESGTSVTIRLNNKVIAAGLLDESRLKPMFTKILERTQYTVAFSSDTVEASTIIAASETEKIELAKLEYFSIFIVAFMSSFYL